MLLVRRQLTRSAALREREANIMVHTFHWMDLSAGRIAPRAARMASPPVKLDPLRIKAPPGAKKLVILLVVVGSSKAPSNLRKANVSFDRDVCCHLTYSLYHRLNSRSIPQVGA